VCAGAWLLAVFLPAARLLGQSLEPRAYSPSPTGTNFALASLAHQDGSVVFDASLPITDVSAKVNAAALGYVRTFDLFGRSASAAIALPYVWGTISGRVEEQAREISRSGIGDTTVRLVSNLLGGPALDPKAFAARAPETTLGLALYVVAPTGQYFPDKLINVGSHRWSFKPELGFSHPAGPWVFEAYAGVWFFTANDDFFGGHVRTQNPLAAFQGHVSYTFPNRIWIAADGTYYTGGQTATNGVPNDDRQANSRVGVTASVPLARTQALKFAYSRGAGVRFGQNFSTYTLTYQLLWFDRKPGTTSP
jgi:hypothetical protein